MRTRDRARLENEEREEEDCRRGKNRRAHAASGIDEPQRRRHSQRRQRLNARAAGAPPRKVRARIREPGRIALAVVRIREAEDVGPGEAPRDVLPPLREVPPEVRLVD
jgi:hypothetical protein